MTPPPARRRHLASSPFPPAPDAVIEEFARSERVHHDTFGMGRVVGVEPHAVTVDFGTQTRRITSPFPKLHHL